MNDRTLTSTEKVNKVCAAGSVTVALAAFFGGTFILAIATVIIAEAIDWQSPLHNFVHSVPNIPYWIRWPLDAVTVLWLATKFYPKCMKARLRRRFSHG